jgi:hypothetical protein
MPVTTPYRNRLFLYTGDVPDEEDPRLSLVLDFLNTVDVEERTDELREPESFRAWMRTHGLAGPASLDAARDFRTALRGAVGDTVAGPAVAAPAPSTTTAVPVEVRLDSEGRPTLTARDPLGRIAAAAVGLVEDGRWDRVKICAASDCRWAFYDRSKNHSRHWCSMGVCGNRSKSRTFRRRRRAGESEEQR